MSIIAYVYDGYYYSLPCELANNTVVATNATGIRVAANGGPVLKNNIVLASGMGKFCISAYDGKSIENSNFNNLLPLDNAKVGNISQYEALTLTEWCAALGLDPNSLSNDPLFADPSAGDFHLRSSSGRWDSGASGGLGAWILDTNDSPCLDAGDPADGVGAEPAPNGGRINLGAFGGTTEASKSPASSRWLVFDRAGNRQPLHAWESLRWTARGNNWSPADTIRIEISPDSGASWQPIPGAANLAHNAASHWWDSRTVADGTTYRFRVVDNSDASTSNSDLCDYAVRNRGTINVTCNISRGTFQILGPQNHQGGGPSWSEFNASLGVYTIVWTPVAGYTGTPASETKELAYPGETIAFTGTYLDTTPPSGWMIVNGDACCTSITSVLLTLSAADEGSGMASGKMQFANSTTPPSSWSSLETYRTQKSWTLSSGQGTKTVWARFQDAAGNYSTPTSDTILLDQTVPTVALSTTSPNPFRLSPMPVQATFSETVTGFEVGDLTVVNAQVVNFTGSGTSYSFDLIPQAQGAVSVSVASGKARDLAGNPNTASSGLTRTYDSVRPTGVLSSTAPNPTRVSPIPVTVTFSESVLNFAIGDVVTTNGTVTNFSGSGASYSFNLTPAGQGDVMAAIPGEVANDAAGNMNHASSTLIRFFDNLGPTGWIVVNNGDCCTSVTSVQLSLGAEDGGVGMDGGQMVVANYFPPSSYASWQAYNTTRSWTLLTGQGTKTVYVQFRDGLGNASATFSDAILLDQTAPTVAIIPAGGLFTGSVEVTLTGQDANGVREIRYTLDGSDPRVSSTACLYNQPIVLMQTTLVRAASWDMAGNISTVASQQFTATIPLAEALEYPADWSTGGHANWYGQSTTFIVDGDAAQSGAITHNQTTWMEMVTTGPVLLSFYWKVSSEACCDPLEFLLDTVVQDSIRGAVDWQQKTFMIASGAHTLRWQYRKNGSLSSGSDCGWVDEVSIMVLTPTPTPTPSLTPSPTASPTPSPTSSATPTPSPSVSPTSSPSISPTPSPSPSPSVSLTSTPEPSITPTPSPTASTTSSPSYTSTPTPVASPTPSPTASTTPEPTPSPTPTTYKPADHWIVF